MAAAADPPASLEVDPILASLPPPPSAHVAFSTPPPPSPPDPLDIPPAYSPEEGSENGSETDDEEAENQLRLSTLLPIIVLVVIYILILLLFAIYRDDVIPVLEKFRLWIRGYGFWGVLIVAGVVMTTAFPPVPAYGIITVFCGVVYGWYGFIPFFIGALLGADLTFLFFRKVSQGYAHRIMIENPKIAAVVWAVERRGFQLLFLIRLAPYPFSLMNAILASSKVPFWQFNLATMFTLPKMLVNIGLGAHLRDFAEFFQHPTLQGWLMFGFFSALAAFVFVYVGWIGLKEIRQLEKEGTRWNKKAKRWEKREQLKYGMMV